MHPPVSPEQKEGMRELRMLLPPTYPRIAKIAGLHVTTVREIASREGWPRLHVPHGSVMQVVRLKDVQEQAATLARAEALAAMSEDAAGGPDYPAGDLGALMIDDLRAMLGELRHGRVDKARIDTLNTMIRAYERLGKSATSRDQPGQEEQTRSDEELAAILTRIDERIVELARDYAERLVAGEFEA